MTKKSRTLLLALVTMLLAGGCSSSTKSTSSMENKVTIVTPPRAPATEEYAPNLGLAFSAGGYGKRPPDAFGIDSTHAMGFETRSRDKNGVWHSLKGLAVVEEWDYAALLKIVTEGKLLDIDPTEVLGECSNGELYTLSLTSSRLPHAIHLDYSSCSLDYNLLSEPQRSHFVQLNVWLDSMRTHYRPRLPD